MKSFYETYENAKLARDRGAYTPPASDTNNVAILEAGVKKVVAIPAGAKVVVFSANVDFFVKFGSENTTLQVPKADVTDGSAGEFNPGSRQIGSAAFMHFISSESGFVQISYYEA